jgi:endonuclease/exonuclease/phosphatase (EEP) superfamily protein YafD
MKLRWKTRAIHWLRVFTWLYFMVVFGWAIAHPFFGDHPWWMFAVNALAFYLFAPLPLVLLIAFSLRRLDIWLGAFVVFLLAVFLYGKLFLPRQASAASGEQSIKVMTYNLLRYNEHTDAVTNAILASGADVVGLQELNPQVAKAIRQNLKIVYPYQQLDARDDSGGLGVISRYPLRLSAEPPPGNWLQIVSVSIGGKPVTLLNVHVESTNPSPIQMMEATIAKRERQVRATMDFVAAHPGSLVMIGDFNSTLQNTTYQEVTRVLTDSWMEAGWGLGHTFPGVLSSSSARLTIAGMDVPPWLIRIDYIFHSRHFHALDAQIGPWDGYSDHRPVIARLVLGKE